MINLPIEHDSNKTIPIPPSFYSWQNLFREVYNSATTRHILNVDFIDSSEFSQTISRFHYDLMNLASKNSCKGNLHLHLQIEKHQGYAIFRVSGSAFHQIS